MRFAFSNKHGTSKETINFFFCFQKVPEFDFLTALPYLIGGAVGGIVGGRLFKNVSNVWLRRIFAAFLLYGGVRYLL